MAVKYATMCLGFIRVQAKRTTDKMDMEGWVFCAQLSARVSGVCGTHRPSLQ
jgi:hypothetical protein